MGLFFFWPNLLLRSIRPQPYVLEDQILRRSPWFDSIKRTEGISEEVINNKMSLFIDSGTESLLQIKNKKSMLEIYASGLRLDS